MKAGEWLGRLGELCQSVLGRDAEPIAFLLGAGASITSGAPSTQRVAEVIQQANPARFPTVESVFARLIRITEQEKRNAIEPLFSDVRPYVGYYMLAALGYNRPITVVNLNWDSCIATACNDLGITCWAHDIADPESIRISREAQREAGAGVLVVHVHGHLQPDGNATHRLRFATLETIDLKGEELDLIAECLQPSLLIAGASLSDRELDTAQLIKAIGAGAEGASEAIKPVWVAVRQSTGLVLDRTLHRALRDRKSGENIVEGPDVDFDRVMWALRAMDGRYPWADLQANHPDINLLDEHELTMPNPDLLRSPLQDPVPALVLPGRGRQGKSTVAHMLAHWTSLCRRSVPRVRTYRYDQANDALGVLETDQIVVLDDPFGDIEDLAAPQVYDSLRLLPSGMGSVIVSSRFERYETARRLAGGAALPRVSGDPSRWWGRDDLARYAERFDEDTQSLVVSDPHRFNTPYRVREAAVRGPDAVGGNEVEQTTRWLYGQLSEKAPQATLTVLVRLQDFYQPMPAGDLQALVGYAPDLDAGDQCDGLLRTVVVHQEYLRISHPDDVEAVDRLIREHRELVEETVGRLSPNRPWIWEALTAWDAVVGSTQPPIAEELEDSVLFEWIFELVQRAAAHSPAAAVALLQAALARAPDSWALREVVFAMVCMWGRIADNPSAKTLIRNVRKEKKRRGLYALVEALLRVRNDPPIDLMAMAVEDIFELGRAGKDREQLLLIFDAMLWRELPVTSKARQQLLKVLLSAAVSDEKLRAGFAMAAAYHRPGLQAVLDAGLENPLQWTGAARRHPEMVVWLLQWHVVHQARVHAVVTRQSFLPPDADEIRYLGRGQHESEDSLADDQVHALRSLIGEVRRSADYKGWSVHLALNVIAVAGALEVADLDVLINDSEPDDAGLATCVLYSHKGPLATPLREYLKTKGRDQALEVLGEGFVFEGTHVSAPRFRLVADGWSLRGSWQLSNSRLSKAVGCPSSAPAAFLAWLWEHHDDALEAGADERGLQVVMRRAELGDTRVLEKVQARSGERDGSVAASILAGASHIVARDGS